MKAVCCKIIRRFFKVVQKIRIIYYAGLSSDIDIQGTLLKNQPLLVVGNGKIIIHGTATIGYFPSPFFFSSYAHFDLRQKNACIEIGNNVVINNNSTLIADGATISIGCDTLIGLNISIMTSDAHTLQPEERASPNFPRENVTIGKNVFIGNNVTVLKGVTIGDNSIIGNGSIVVNNIPANVLAAGVPCKTLRTFHG